MVTWLFPGRGCAGTGTVKTTGLPSGVLSSAPTANWASGETGSGGQWIELEARIVLKPAGTGFESNLGRRHMCTGKASIPKMAGKGVLSVQGKGSDGSQLTTRILS